MDMDANEAPAITPRAVPGLAAYVERYTKMGYEPLAVTLELTADSALAGYDPLNFDNLLARCVVDEVGGPQTLGLETQYAYALPVPLAVLWRDPRGWPLYATTQFFPPDDESGGLRVGYYRDPENLDVLYFHKRSQSGRMTGTKRGTFNMRAGNGRYRDRRAPLPVSLAPVLVAYCVGNADEIARLLAPLKTLGKRRNNGLAKVKRWVIRRLYEGFSLWQDDAGHGKVMRRSLPALAVELLPEGYMPTTRPAPVGWTPPQWKRELFAPGWWAGEPISPIGGVDFFGVAPSKAGGIPL